MVKLDWCVALPDEHGTILLMAYDPKAQEWKETGRWTRRPNPAALLKGEIGRITGGSTEAQNGQ